MVKDGHHCRHARNANSQPRLAVSVCFHTPSRGFHYPLDPENHCYSPRAKRCFQDAHLKISSEAPPAFSCLLRKMLHSVPVGCQHGAGLTEGSINTSPKLWKLRDRSALAGHGSEVTRPGFPFVVSGETWLNLCTSSPGLALGTPGFAGDQCWGGCDASHLTAPDLEGSDEDGASCLPVSSRPCFLRAWRAGGVLCPPGV